MHQGNDQPWLYSLIAASTSGETCLCDLAEVVGLSQSIVSHQMKLLVDAGLVTGEQRRRWPTIEPTGRL